MRISSRTSNGLLTLKHPEKIRLLFMAPYAPNGPDYDMSSYLGAGGYPDYYFEIFNRLKKLKLQVESTSKPYAVTQADGMFDYVFSLFNRMPIRNSEVFVSSYCEYLNIPYLGACPNIRAAAEDKFISKMVAQSLGIPVPQGQIYHYQMSPLRPPLFPGPYFIKDRYGAGSEGLTIENVQEDWSGAKRIVQAIWEQGSDALVEEMVEGIDITVPVIGDKTPRMLGVVHVPSDKPNNILTEDLKLTDPLGYRMYDAPTQLLSTINTDAKRLWNALGPMDYFRLDYRLNPETGVRKFLEFNVCCYISEDGAFGLSSKNKNITADELLAHIISYSLIRQGGWRKYSQRIL